MLPRGKTKKGTDVMFKKEDVSPGLWNEVEKLNQKIVHFQRDIKAAQDACCHAWNRIMQYDPNYSPRLDDRSKGQHVIKEFHCPVCNLRRPLVGLPFQVCHKCGGKMKHDRTEQCGMDRAFIHKCEDCGHEYDTT